MYDLEFLKCWLKIFNSLKKYFYQLKLNFTYNLLLNYNKILTWPDTTYDIIVLIQRNSFRILSKSCGFK